MKSRTTIIALVVGVLLLRGSEIKSFSGSLRELFLKGFNVKHVTARNIFAPVGQMAGTCCF